MNNLCRNRRWKFRLRDPQFLQLVVQMWALIEQQLFGDFDRNLSGTDVVASDGIKYIVTHSGDWNCRGETFTAICGSSIPSLAKSAICRHTARTTHWPMRSIRPESFATRMNSFGIKRPRTGCCQRNNASSPTYCALDASTMGWNSRKNSFLSSAERKSDSTPALNCAIWLSWGEKKQWQLRPFDLASYIARSARRSSSSAELPSCGISAIPILAPIICSDPPIR